MLKCLLFPRNLKTFDTMTGIDLSPAFVQNAKEKAFHVHMGRIDLSIEAFAREFPLTEGCQDFALSTLVLDRIANPKRFLANLFWVLKDEGRFAIQTLLPIVPVDDGKVETPIIYTPEDHRITPGETIDGDKLYLLALLDDLQVCR